MIKLIASDLDGTLLPEGTMDVNPELFDVIRRLKKKGVTFAAVSGREYDSIAKVFEPVKDDIYFIAGNGGVISYQDRSSRRQPSNRSFLKKLWNMQEPRKGSPL